MTTKLTLLIAMAAFGLFLPCLHGQTTNLDVGQIIHDLELAEYAPDENASLQNFLSLIKSDMWAQVPTDQKERAVAAFIKTLRRGARLVGRIESEEGRQYLMLLGEISATLKDKRTIPILADGVVSGYFQGALVAIGRPAIPVLVKRYGDKTVAGTGNGKSMILEIFMEMGPDTVGTENNVVELAVNACKDKDSGVRKAAVMALGALGDRRHIAMLEKIAADDQKYYEVKTTTTSFRKYVVRDKAKAALEKLRKRFPDKPEKNN